MTTNPSENANPICLLLLTFVLPALTLPVNQSMGQASLAYQQRIESALATAQDFHIRAERLPNSSDRYQRRMQLYISMAKKMTPSPSLEHIKFPSHESLPTSEDQIWLADAMTIASGLKPSINYQVKKHDLDAVICVDEKLASSLQKNVKLVAWYRGEIARQGHDLESDKGSQALAELIDQYFTLLSDSLPKLKIRRNGRLNMARENIIRFSNNKLWAILAAINRYFFYKAQIHDLSHQCQAANYVLIESMIKTAAFYGAAPPNRALEEIKIEFGSENDKSWKKAVADAFDALETEAQSHDGQALNLCQIKVPPKPKPVRAPSKPKSNSFPTDVEDVKEVGGQIFIKRNGRWGIWKSK